MQKTADDHGPFAMRPHLGDLPFLQADEIAEADIRRARTARHARQCQPAKRLRRRSLTLGDGVEPALGAGMLAGREGISFRALAGIRKMALPAAIGWRRRGGGGAAAMGGINGVALSVSMGLPGGGSRKMVATCDTSRKALARQFVDGSEASKPFRHRHVVGGACPLKERTETTFGIPEERQRPVERDDTRIDSRLLHRRAYCCVLSHVLCLSYWFVAARNGGNLFGCFDQSLSCFAHALGALSPCSRIDCSHCLQRGKDPASKRRPAYPVLRRQSEMTSLAPAR